MFTSCPVPSTHSPSSSTNRSKAGKSRIGRNERLLPIESYPAVSVRPGDDLNIHLVNTWPADAPASVRQRTLLEAGTVETVKLTGDGARRAVAVARFTAASGPRVQFTL